MSQLAVCESLQYLFVYFFAFQLGCSPDRLIVKLMDLTKFSTIRAAAKEITAGSSHLI